MFNFKKKFGQNFLNNSSAIQKIVTNIELKNKNVIEIGPGAGVLSKAILEQGAKLTCYEIDFELKPILETNLASYPNKEIIFKDFLKIDLNLANDYYLIANPPYNISGEIINRFIKEEHFKIAILMFQEELAKRVLATLGDSAYSKLSIILDYFTIKEKIAFVNKKSFTPIPKINSIVFKLTKKENRMLTKDDELKFLEFINACFITPRKTLNNNLLISKKYDKEILSKIDFDLSRRPEEYSYKDYIKIYQCITIHIQK